MRSTATNIGSAFLSLRCGIQDHRLCFPPCGDEILKPHRSTRVKMDRPDHGTRRDDTACIKALIARDAAQRHLDSAERLIQFAEEAESELDDQSLAMIIEAASMTGGTLTMGKSDQRASAAAEDDLFDGETRLPNKIADSNGARLLD